MNWILNFLWVLVVEYIQNIPFMVGIVAGLSGIRRGLPWWEWSPMFVGGSFASAVLISSMDWIKVMATTRTAKHPNLLRMLRMGIIFSVACGLLVVYFILTSPLEKSSLADVVFGILIGAATAIVQARNNFPPRLVALHALGFAVTGGSMVALIRWSAEVAPGWQMLAWVGWLTLMMSILIVLFDYVPFLRR
jgi:hypothetical protein